MSPPGMKNGTVKSIVSAGTIFEIEDHDVMRSSDRPKPIKVVRNKSFDEKSSDHVSSPCRRSELSTPGSHSCHESHPMIVNAWECLRQSLVYFRSQPVGTIAALDHSAEELNYDQVNLSPLLSCFFN